MKKYEKIDNLCVLFSQDLKSVQIRLGYEKTSIFIKDFEFIIFGLIGLILV